MITVILLLAIALFSLSIVIWVRCYALNHLLDIPNQRSSHQQPTPRGGGLAIVIAFSVAMLLHFINGNLEVRYFSAFALGSLVAGIGFWDDHQHVSAFWRLLVHVCVSLAAAYLLINPIPENFYVFFHDISLAGIFGSAFFLAWTLNLFNFMDGIDGIAGSEAIFVPAVLAGLMWFSNSDLAWVGAALAASSLGFLTLNWPPAKIFMGDVGSGFSGFVIGLLILLYGQIEPKFLMIGFILFSVFICDASYTLMTRLINGEKWYQAHCSHAYQHAAKRFGHLKVLLLVWTINLFWLLPLAILVFIKPELGLLGLFFAYVPLCFLARKFNAGRP